MCGRFTLRTPLAVVIERFQLDLGSAKQLALFKPRYNIAPTQEVLVVRAAPDSGERQSAMLRWGLVPSWMKDLKGGPPMINARAETVAEKPAFRTAVRRRRCLIPADGYYEWQEAAGAGNRAKKQPYFIHRRDDRPFAFAGLWETWQGKQQSLFDKHATRNIGPTIESCTIITTAASVSLASLYDRMPVILAPNDYGLWLDPAVQDVAAIGHMLGPGDDEEIIAEPVSTHVNRVANDDAQCVAPISTA